LLRRHNRPTREHEPEAARKRAIVLYWLGPLVIGLTILSCVTSITGGRPGAAAVSVMCLYLAWTAWRRNAESLERIKQGVVDEPGTTDSDS